MLFALALSWGLRAHDWHTEAGALTVQCPHLPPRSWDFLSWLTHGNKVGADLAGAVAGLRAPNSLIACMQDRGCLRLSANEAPAVGPFQARTPAQVITSHHDSCSLAEFHRWSFMRRRRPWRCSAGSPRSPWTGPLARRCGACGARARRRRCGCWGVGRRFPVLKLKIGEGCVGRQAEASRLALPIITMAHACCS